MITETSITGGLMIIIETGITEVIITEIEIIEDRDQEVVIDMRVTDTMRSPRVTIVTAPVAAEAEAVVGAE